MKEYANEETYKRYLFFWSGQLFSLLGSLVIFFAIFVWITDVTGDPLMLALANFFYMVPMLIITPIAGDMIGGELPTELIPARFDIRL